MAFTDILEHTVVSSAKRGSLTIGSEPSHLRVRIHEKYMALTRQLCAEAFTSRNEIFVTTTTESISV